MAFFRSNPDVDHDLAVMGVGEEASGPDSNGVGLYHFAYELGSFEELQDAYRTVLSRTTSEHCRLRRPRRHEGVCTYSTPTGTRSSSMHLPREARS